MNLTGFLFAYLYKMFYNGLDESGTLSQQELFV